MRAKDFMDFCGLVLAVKFSSLKISCITNTLSLRVMSGTSVVYGFLDVVVIVGVVHCSLIVLPILTLYLLVGGLDQRVAGP